MAVDDLTLNPDNRVSGRVVVVSGAPQHPAAMCAALAVAPATEATLNHFDAVMLRYHPRREGGGRLTPIIDFGWRLRLGGVVVVNDPEGTQRAGGRMYLTGLPPQLRPRTLVTREVGQAKAFLKSLGASAVVKPLADRETGRDQVFYLGRGQVKNRNQILSLVKKRGYFIVQEYLADVVHGEKRLLLVGGEPVRRGDRVAIYRRVGTGDGSTGPLPVWLQGSERKACDFGAVEQKIVDTLRPRLDADGLSFVGVDVVGDKVIDLNVYTPGGLQANLDLYGIDVADAVIRDLERRVEVRRAYRTSIEQARG